MSPAAFNRFLLAVAGIGGLLYGIDVGIFDAAVLYLGKTISLTVSQLSIIAAAVFGGSMVSSLVAGFFADWVGRKKMMVASGLLFVISIGMIVTSQNFAILLTGRLLQGISGGVIAVVVPLYLAECLNAKTRGRGSAVFQFMLTFGIMAAAFIGLYYTTHTEAAVVAAHGNSQLIRVAEDHAWRGMFLAIIYPGILFFLGTLFLSETPRWLFRRGRKEQALASLRRFSDEEEAQLQMREMDETMNAASSGDHAAKGSLLQRKYVVPFVLACVVLACNQATGINSILTYLSLILKQAGMTAQHATIGDLAVKILNCVMTVVAVLLIDRKGRKFLLTLGTAGIILALSGTALIFHHFETQRIDVSSQVNASIQNNAVRVPLAQLQGTETRPVALTVLYSYGGGDHLASVSTSDVNPVLEIAPENSKQPLQIRKASLAPLPSPMASKWILACLTFFMASFAVGPGVVVWLALSELMPTRIRSAGMGIALLLNQGVSTLIAGVFLPMVSKYGYFAVFAFWAGCTVIYFITAAFFLPETKGKTLEEIEASF
ncbi:MAG: MFS transporter [Acidobacteria bacterium]|nr:MFS transporter [Acidobacteriota bacterium]